jgi:hypothetical protein
MCAAKKDHGFWDDVKGHFLDHLGEINDKLASAERPQLEVKSKGLDGIYGVAT